MTAKRPRPPAIPQVSNQASAQQAEIPAATPPTATAPAAADPAAGPAHDIPTNNLRAIALVIASMALFVVEDMFIKLLSGPRPDGLLSVAQIMVMFSGVGIVFFASLAVWRGRRFFGAQAWRPIALVRACCEGLAAFGFFTAIAHADLSVLTTVLMAMPIVVTLGAAAFLREKVGPIRWIAVLIGFLGVLLIIRPGASNAIAPQTYWILLSVVSIAARDLLTRRMTSASSPELISIQAYATTFVLGLILLAFEPAAVRMIAPVEITMLLVGVVFGALGYLAIVAAMQIGEPSAVSPFRYTRLIFAMAVGVVVLGERPDQLTLLGAAIIAGAGLTIGLRERHAARHNTATPQAPA